jgi:hypothetical protein
MKEHQFEELTLGLSIIITLLAYKFNIDWIFYIFFVKSIIDFASTIKYSYKEIKKERKL